MAVDKATLGGLEFRLNPTAISWDYRVKVSETQTIGGRVVQIYGTTLGDMTIIGSFGVGGWPEQRAFLERMKIVGAQQGVQPVGVEPSPPMRFMLPSHGYDFQLYLKSFTQVGASSSVMWDNSIISPEWQLTMFIVNDNVGLKTVAQDQFINRLAKGLGWSEQTDWKDISKFNGPADAAGENQGFINTLKTGFQQVNAAHGGTNLASGGSAGTRSTPASTQRLAGDSYAQKTFVYLTGKGLSAVQAAGVVGNLMWESGCDPERGQDGGGPGRGIAQWEVGGRWQERLKTGNAEVDLAAQLDYLWFELTGTESGSLNALKGTIDVVSATTVFEQQFERAGDPHLQDRIDLAQAAYASFGKGA